MDQDRKFAINHAIILALANYGKTRLKAVDDLPAMVKTLDDNFLKYNLTKVFGVEDEHGQAAGRSG